MKEENNNERQTRSNRNTQTTKNKKLDRTLNYLIALVCVLIVITAAYIFIGQDDVEETVDDALKASLEEDNQSENPKETDVENEEPINDEQEDKEDVENSTNVEDEQDSSQQGIEERPSDDPIVDTVITNSNWQPTPTSQTGEHVSSYDTNSVDWKEKITTIANAAGLDEDNIIIWKVRNNGSANTAIGTISTKDKVEKYRVSIEWIDGEGWMPVQVEKLNSLKGVS